MRKDMTTSVIMHQEVKDQVMDLYAAEMLEIHRLLDQAKIIRHCHGETLSGAQRVQEAVRELNKFR